MSRMTWWFSVYSSFRCASDANDADGMFPCRLFNGLCFFLSHRPKWCPWQFLPRHSLNCFTHLKYFNFIMTHFESPFYPLQAWRSMSACKRTAYDLDDLMCFSCWVLRLSSSPWPSQSSRTDACHPPRTRQVKNASTSMSIAVVTATVIKGGWSVCVFHPL